MFGKFKNQFVGVSPSGKAPDSDSGIPRFESSYPSQFKKSLSSLFNAIGVSPSGKALVSDTSIPGFESLHPSQIAQLGPLLRALLFLSFPFLIAGPPYGEPTYAICYNPSA